MKLHTMGLNFRHDGRFAIDRPNGSGDDLILIFKTAAIVRLGGEMIKVPMNSAVVFTKEYPQHYSADGGEYINHWVHFECNETSSFIQAIGLPFNTIIPIQDISATENILDLLSLESVSDSTNREENTDLLLRLLLSKLAEGAEKDRAKTLHSGKLRVLRAEIYRKPAEKRNITDLADSMSLSPSHFQYLYKAEFGISCYEDLLIARLDMAKYYLSSTALSIKEISELCGYDNDVHFIRQFKKRTGITASNFRKLNQ